MFLELYNKIFLYYILFGFICHIHENNKEKKQKRLEIFVTVIIKKTIKKIKNMGVRHQLLRFQH